MLLAALPASVFTGAPVWLTAAIAVCTGCVLLVFLGAYIYLLLKMPDALRSEQYMLSKLALEKGMIGDNVAGLHDPRVIEESRPALVAIDSNQDGRSQ
jgi:hypothetical protein